MLSNSSLEIKYAYKSLKKAIHAMLSYKKYMIIFKDHSCWKPDSKDIRTAPKFY